MVSKIEIDGKTFREFLLTRNCPPYNAYYVIPQRSAILKDSERNRWRERLLLNRTHFKNTPYIDHFTPAVLGTGAVNDSQLLLTTYTPIDIPTQPTIFADLIQDRRFTPLIMRTLDGEFNKQSLGSIFREEADDYVFNYAYQELSSEKARLIYNSPITTGDRFNKYSSERFGFEGYTKDVRRRIKKEEDNIKLLEKYIFNLEEDSGTEVVNSVRDLFYGEWKKIQETEGSVYTNSTPNRFDSLKRFYPIPSPKLDDIVSDIENLIENIVYPDGLVYNIDNAYNVDETFGQTPDEFHGDYDISSYKTIIEDKFQGENSDIINSRLEYFENFKTFNKNICYPYHNQIKIFTWTPSKSKTGLLFSSATDKCYNCLDNEECRKYSFIKPYMVKSLSGVTDRGNIDKLNYEKILAPREGEDEIPIFDNLKSPLGLRWLDTKGDGKSVLTRDKHLKIAYSTEDIDKAVTDRILNVKNFMLSIENLAWKDVTYFADEFERGPFGGRVMWFAPYDVTINDNNSVTWEPHDFIGRGEQIFTYKNTKRSGNLSFKLLIDHNSFQNLYYDEEMDKYNIKELLNNRFNNTLASTTNKEFEDRIKVSNQKNPGPDLVENVPFYKIVTDEAIGAPPVDASTDDYLKEIRSILESAIDTKPYYKMYKNGARDVFSEIRQDSAIALSLREQIANFHPTFHSYTPESYSARLNFLLQLTRQGPSLHYEDPNNLAFGRAPIAVLRLGDLYFTKIVINNVNISFGDGQILWDLNYEGAGVIPMTAKIDINFDYIGGSSLCGPVEKLQNAISFNFFANGEIYDRRAETTTCEREKQEVPDQLPPTIIDNIQSEEIERNIPDRISTPPPSPPPVIPPNIFVYQPPPNTLGTPDTVDNSVPQETRAEALFNIVSPTNQEEEESQNNEPPNIDDYDSATHLNLDHNYFPGFGRVPPN